MLYTKLTAEQKAAYLADSSRCPFCGALDIDGGEVQCEGDSHHQNITCLICNREWVDTYKLVEVDEGEQSCDQCGEVFHEGDEVEEGDYGGLVHVTCPDQGK